MRAYQLYLFGACDEIEDVTAVINCGDDMEAIRKVELLANGHDIELWDGSRFIRRIRPHTAMRSVGVDLALP
jgi:hypothetical protein